MTYVNNLYKLFKKLDEDKTVAIIPKIFFDDYSSRHFDEQRAKMYSTIEIDNTYYIRSLMVSQASQAESLFNKWYVAYYKLYV